jgi:hypothetical protein
MTPMDPRKDSMPALRAAAGKRYSGLAVLAQSLLASLVLVSTVGSAQYFASGGAPWFLHGSGDVVDSAEANARAAAFAALKALPLSLVPAAEMATAIDGMGLSTAQKAAMASQFQAAAPEAKTPDIPAPTAAPAAAPAPSQSTHANRLAWITLWDTDAEDGDAVRIDSQGYSRTITLTKQPVTFAVPVPLDGVVKVTGVRDGEGGGITVGFASGASRAAFPIMSVGQTLGLNVRLD